MYRGDGTIVGVEEGKSKGGGGGGDGGGEGGDGGDGRSNALSSDGATNDQQQQLRERLGRFQDM